MKTYTLTESELQELLRQQREICAKPFVQSIAERIRETPSPPTEEEGIKEDDVSQKFLLHLVDVIWMTAKESEEVPSTIWAKKMIKQAKESYVPSDNNNEGASVASHSYTSATRIKQIIELLSDAHNLLAKSDLSAESYKPISFNLAVAKIELFTLLNSDKNVQVGDTSKAS